MCYLWATTCEQGQYRAELKVLHAMYAVCFMLLRACRTFYDMNREKSNVLSNVTLD